MLLPLLLVVELCRVAAAVRCDRQPDSVTAPSQTTGTPFGLRVAALPPVDQPAALPRPASTYLPGQDYIVSLAGEHGGAVRHFTDFMLTVESLEELETGSFSPSGNTFTKFSERCRNAVVQTSSMPKREVSAYWRAPAPGSGCVVFRASVVEMPNLWYMDEGPLSLQLCEEQSVEETGPAVLDQCCACEEAKYEMAFEGLWSRHTHPKDFPKDHFKAKFSDVIGASHMVDYRFWNYGEFASEGLKELAEEGSTRTLESELKEKSQNIRTIIKARGIGYPNVTGKTFAVFRVDRKNHLVSVVSKLAPSPDWVVGVSGLELCLPNCSWVEKQKVELYPWDIGTDSGVSYESDDSPSIPAEPIIKITSNFPNDPLSPFYDPRGEDMKPLASLYVTRQRLYEKDSCEEGAEQPDGENSCALTQWSQWTPCSASCGEGRRQRRRFYEDPARARAARCRAALSSRTSCVGPPCRDRQRLEGSSARCELSEWDEWSACSASCGTGYHTRSRHYLQAHARTWCARQPGAPLLEEAENCDAGPACDDGGGEEGGDEEAGGEYGEREGEDGGEDEGEGEGEDGGDEREYGEDREEGYGENREEYGQEDGNGDDDYDEGDDGERPEGSWDNPLLGKRLDNPDANINLEKSDGGDEEEDDDAQCPRMTEWTAWSPCSVSCGRGTRIRNRYLDATDEDTAMIASLMSGDEDEEGDDDYRQRPGGDDGEEDCDSRTVMEEECDGDLPSCDPPTEEEREICLTEKDKGPCYNAEIRWHYDKETQSCQQFEYGGCRGNRNKFNTREACEQMCAGVTEEDGTTEGGPFGGLVAGNQITNTRGLGLAAPTYPYAKARVTSPTGRVLDCVVSPWSRWSACSATCGPSYKQRTRTIKVYPINGGKACPRKLLRRKKCHVALCDDRHMNRPLHRRHSEEDNYEDVYGNSVDKNTLSEGGQEDILNEILPYRPAEIPKDSEERSEGIRQTFSKPPFIRILHSDETDCELSQWTEWSPCSMTCGISAYKQRTRSVITRPSVTGLPCGKRIEVESCTLPFCKP